MDQGTLVSERSEPSVQPVHLPQMRPPSFWPGSICHLPPTQVEWLLRDGVSESLTGLIPPSVCAPTGILVNGSVPQYAREKTLGEIVFRNLFSRKKSPLTGAPP